MFSEEAVRNLSRMPPAERALLKEGIRKHMVEADPGQTTRNKFRLRRVSPFAEFELRIRSWRVFYRIRDSVVEVIMIGEKRGNRLLIGGEEFDL